MVLDHLRSAPITPMEALDAYGCFRLAARIYELRKDGHQIVTVMTPAMSNRKRYATYHLLKQAR